MSARTAYIPPDGPRWLPPRSAIPGTTRQTDGRGITWLLERSEQGGRVLHWRTTWYEASNPRAMLPGGGNIRRAVTTAVEGHPEYPSDADVVAATRAARKAAARAAAAAGRYYP